MMKDDLKMIEKNNLTTQILLIIYTYGNVYEAGCSMNGDRFRFIKSREKKKKGDVFVYVSI